MTLQQMEYIVALDQYRHFVLAAESCGITQPTLSAMLQKLEEELDVKIFNRDKKSITPTAIGEKIIRQAQIALNEAMRIKEVVADESDTMKGSLRIGVLPTIAPYLVPDFIYHFKQAHPAMDLFIDEKENKSLVQDLEYGNLDLAITTAPHTESRLLEIPVYHEPFVVYLSAACQTRPAKISGKELPPEHLWILKEGHCLPNDAFSFCKNRKIGNHIYEAGSIETLIRIVDKNGGYTIIPKLHTRFLSEAQQRNVLPIDTVPPARRTVSIWIKEDFIREKALNAVREIILQIIPLPMCDERFKRHEIKLRR